MKKPTLQTRTETYFDWGDCVDYINEKHDCNIRDFANKFDGNGLPKDKPGDFRRPYQDYWHLVVDIAEVSDGATMQMDNDWIDDGCYDLDDWQIEITTWFLEEFGTGEDRSITFLVQW